MIPETKQHHSSLIEEDMDTVAMRKLLGSRIRDLRETKGYSQDVLAELSGLNRSYIGSLERGEHNCGIANIVRVAKGLEVPLYALFKKMLTGAEKRRPGTMNTSTANAKIGAIVDKKQFLLLLQQCARDRPDLITIYLERCGIVFRE